MTQVRHTIVCPRCKAETQVLGVGLLEIDRCGACGGIWFDVGEIKQLRGLSDDKHVRTDIEALLAAPAQPGTSSVPSGDQHPLACPICALRMQRKHHEDAPGVVIDRCVAHGTWLDRGEAVRLLELAAKTAQARRQELAERRGAKKESWLSAILDLFD